MQEPDLVADLELLCGVVREAGAHALQYWKKDLKVWEKEPGHPVSVADIEVDELLRETLCEARPDYGWLSEETADSPDRLSKDFLFVVDPIDGTRAFIDGDPNFCVCAAILHKGIPVVGAIFNPAFDEFYDAYAGGGARLNGQTINASTRDQLPDARLIATPTMFNHPAWPTPWPTLVHPDVKPNATAYRMMLVADGRWDGVIVLWRKGDWDVAAASLIVEEAGGYATTHEGEAFAFNRPVASQKSLIAAGPNLHPLLIERCKHVRLPDPNESI